MIEIEVSKNYNKEKGLNFKSKENESLYFIPLRLLGAIDTSTTLLNKTYGFPVLTQIMRVAKNEWANKELLFKLMNLIVTHKNIKDSNLIADTFIVIRDFYKIDIISDEYLVGNPPPDNSTDAFSAWNEKYKKQLKIFIDKNLKS